jgi:putrescine aminotransferase
MTKHSRPSESKTQAMDHFRDHVSSSKAAFYKKYGMEFVMGRREGNFLWDIDGEKRLFNLHCNGGVFNMGHRNEELRAVLTRSLEELDIGNHHLMSAERAGLAALISSLMPGDLDYAVFGVGGGEAVDLAFKVARAYTGRFNIISAQGGYHGHTGLALAAGDAKYRDIFGPQLPHFIQVPFGDIDALREKVDGSTAAVILETVPATLGMVIPSVEYMQSVREICSGTGALMILVILGKGLSGGLYPISATILRKPLEEVFHDHPFIHVSTFGGAEPGCRVARRVLEISSSLEFLAHVNLMARRFSDGIEYLRARHKKFLVGLNQLGLMMGLRLKDNLCGPLLTKTAYDNDLLLLYANNDLSVCQLLPPLVMEEKEIDWVLAQLDDALLAGRRLKPILKIKRFFDKWRRKK